ncbi:MAG: tetratricopeptide repeat protein [Candidatus Omnitrophota bacterium]
MFDQRAHKFTKIDFFVIFIIFSLALIIRFAYMSDYMNTGAYPLLAYSDGYYYFTWAKDIAGGDMLGNKAFMKWPLYAYLLALWFKIAGSNVSGVYYLQFILGAANCGLVYLISRNIFYNRVIAVISSLIYLWYALPVFYEGLLIYTSLSLFLNSVFFLFLLRAKEDLNKKKIFGLGILLGICAIVQANIIVFGLAAIFWFIYLKKQVLIRSIIDISFFSLGLFLVLGTTALSNYLAEKDIVLIAGNTGINFYLGNNPEATGSFHTARHIMANQEGMFRDARITARLEKKKSLKTSEVSSFWFRKSLDYMKNNPRSYLELLKKKINYLFSPREAIHDQEYNFIAGNIGIFKVMLKDLRLILPLCILGMFFGLKNLRETFPLFLSLFGFSLGMLIFFVTTRYRIVMVPFMAVFSGYAVFKLGDALRLGKYKNFAWFFIILVLIFALFNQDLFKMGKAADIRARAQNYYAHFYKGVFYYQKSDYPQAITEFQKACDLDPGSPEALFLLGDSYYGSKDLKKAEAKFKDTLRAFPLYIDAYYNLGIMYNQQKRFNEAEDVLNKALSLDPDDFGAHFELGRVYKEKGDFKQAEIEFNFALARINRWRVREREFIREELSDLTK